ncbi:MAG: InlB B-repeat-containing protein [Paludibacteraceae bacterium]|nr:InlB B-repeat-containing protein [Paludibacteraceae bacterium]
MKTLLNSLNRTANKCLFAIFALLITFGVGNAWAGTRRIYFDYSAVTMWKDFTNLNGGEGHAKVHCWGGSTGDQDYELSQVEGEDYLAYCDIDDGWTNIMFYRCGSDNAWWTKTFNYENIGSNNYFKIKNETEKDGTLDKYKWDYAQRWTPSPAIDGLLDPNNPHNQAFDGDGVFTATLDAHTTYQFKILDGSTAYGLDNNVWTSSISNYTLSSTGYDLRLCTAGAGTYTFTYNNSTHQISVAYPVVDHPNIDYCYMYGYNDWAHKYINIWADPNISIAGTTYPGTEMPNYFEYDGEKYYYFSAGNFNRCEPNDNNEGRRTGTLTPSEGYSKYMKYDGSAWVWNTFTVRIQLEDLEATTDVTPNHLDVAFNSDVLADLTTVPEKTHYDFGGFYTNSDGTGTQVIDASGHWIASVPDYTDASKHWIHAGTSTTLYAKWTEIKHTVAVAVSPAGAGSVQVSGENITEVANVGYVTHSPVMTAVPANDAWVFKEWQKTASVHFDLLHHSTTSTTMEIMATADEQTITAVFEPRYGLIGSLNEDGDPAGGMPNKDGVTWGTERSADYEADFEVVGFTALGTGDGTGVDLQCTCSLLANREYKFQVVDRSTIGRDRFCLEENGSAVLEEGNSVTLTYKEKVNANVLIKTGGEGNYTFKITNISNDGNYYPTLIVIRPQQVNFGQKYQDVDGVLHEGTIGGLVAVAKTAGGALSSGDWVTYNTSVTHTATASPGYTFAGWWGSDAFTGDSYRTTNPMTYAVIVRDNAYAQFIEIPTTVTLSNDGHGHVETGGATAASTTVCVTTTRELTAVPNDGYMFSSWTKTSGDDIEITSTSTNPTTLTGLGAGAISGQTLTANFTYRYSIKGTMNDENWGTDHFIANIGTNAGSKDTGYVEMNLPANATYEFAIQDLTEANKWLKNGANAVYNMTYINHTNWPFGEDKSYNCGITTAGKGTYKFIFNITDMTVTVVYPESYQVNYGASVGGSVTSVVDGDGNSVPNGGYVCSGGSVTYTAAAANAYYTFAGWCTDDTYATQFTDNNPWINSGITANSNAYAKFKSTNFVIYRTGDMAEDDRAALDDVEFYAGGTISEEIEYRMKVHTLDQWYTLCLPFTVSAVQVWDPDDGPNYYDIVPFYRTNDKFYTGHYIIRTPETVTNYAIETFEEKWLDPESPTGYLPSANTPYIIQWHDTYFSGKYISFFSPTGQSIPTDFSAGEAPVLDDVVNIYGNNTMHSGTVRDAYLLEPDYGPSGAWLREAAVGTDRTVLPFECFIRANEATTTRYRILRRGATPDDTPTGWEVVMDSEPMTAITVYTLTGIPVARYDGCSFAEAARRLNAEQAGGIYILRSENESVKLMIGGQ